MKELPILRTDKVAFVDDEDYERLSEYKLRLSRHGYVMAYIGDNQERGLHRLILGLIDSDIHVDHKDYNPLNCQKSNLRVCTNQQNSFNQRPRKIPKTSKHKGVSWFPRDSKWRAAIVFNYKQIHIGLFDDEIVAAKEYDRKAKELFGEFAWLNFPEDHHASPEQELKLCKPQ